MNKFINININILVIFKYPALLLIHVNRLIVLSSAGLQQLSFYSGFKFFEHRFNTSLKVYLKIFVCFLGVLFFIYNSALAELATNQKNAYENAKKELFKNNSNPYQLYLKAYPSSETSNYLKFYYYLNDGSVSGVAEFLNANKERAFYNTLLTSVVQIHQSGKNWPAILNILNEGNANTLTLKCALREAYYHTNDTQQAFLDFSNFYVNNNLPKSCDAISNIVVKHNILNQRDLINKIRFLIKTGNISVASFLNMHQNKNPAAKMHFEELIQLYKNINSLDVLKELIEAKSHLASSTLLQGDYLSLVNVLAKKDSISAQELLDLILQLKLVSIDASYATLAQIAIYQAGRVDADADTILNRILGLPKQFQSDELKQWGFRLSAKNENWKQALSFLNGLSDSAKRESTWIYWLGEMHLKLNNVDRAHYYFKKISYGTNFYGFLASDKLNQTYVVLQSLKEQNKPPIVKITDSNFLIAFDLIKVGEMGFARSEWMRALNTTNFKQMHAASIQAYELGKNDLAIRAAVRAQQPGGLSDRYPALYVKDIQKNAKKKSLDWLMVLSLMRQESLFQSDVKSHADAYGLMQLLIPTAEKMSKRLGEKERGSLINPTFNIRYGTEYLLELTEQFGDFWPYLLSGYNAGPQKVKKWINPKIDPALWVESIPYKETRNYVKNILVDRVIYGYLYENSEHDLDFKKNVDLKKNVTNNTLVTLPKISDFLSPR